MFSCSNSLVSIPITYYYLCLFFVCLSTCPSVLSSLSNHVDIAIVSQSSNRFSLEYKRTSYSRNYLYVYVHKKALYIVECKLRVQRIPQSSAFGSSLLVVFIGVNYLHFCTFILLALVVGIGIRIVCSSIHCLQLFLFPTTFVIFAGSF